MNLIELHILQSFPVTCLNRDDLGAPKTAYFGGCQRARVSSQCWKRSIRMMAREKAREMQSRLFEGSRTRKAIEDLSAALQKSGVGDSVEASRIAGEVCRGFLEKPKAEQEGRKSKQRKGEDAAESPTEESPSATSTLLYFCPSELEAMAAALVRARATGHDMVKAATQAAPLAHLTDGADIAIFGRMVANAPSLTLEGAGLFSHALSTHRVDNDIDFWTAVEDEKQADEDAGAANMGTIEFNSACYYRYVGLNLNMLADEAHLGHLSAEDRSTVIGLFLRAAILAVPQARKNSMFGFNPPAFVLGLRRRGQPLALVNAFEAPVQSTAGYLDASWERMREWWGHLQKCYGLGADAEVQLPPTDLNTLIASLV